MSDPKPKLDSIFEAAAKILSADKRAAFLARECGDDIVLRHQIEKLLESDRIAGSFLENAPPGSSRPPSVRFFRATSCVPQGVPT